MEKILIGGKALQNLGSSRSTLDTDYLINDTASTSPFIHDTENNVDYLNANGLAFFSEIFAVETGNAQASPNSLLELKAFALVQHCQNAKWQKADDAEYDIKFLVRNFGVKNLDIVKRHVGGGELAEIQKIINSVK